jgi:Xaa-Pro aminopeptidase
MDGEVQAIDPFLNLSACLLRIEYISGFSGSAATAVITLERAALATDGRYFNQASKQLDSNWELLKQGMTDVPTWQEWYILGVDNIMGQ